MALERPKTPREVRVIAALGVAVWSLLAFSGVFRAVQSGRVFEMAMAPILFLMAYDEMWGARGVWRLRHWRDGEMPAMGTADKRASNIAHLLLSAIGCFVVGLAIARSDTDWSVWFSAVMSPLFLALSLFSLVRLRSATKPAQ